MEYDSYLILGRFWGMDQSCSAGKWDGFKKMVAAKNSQFICGFHGVPFGYGSIPIDTF